MSVYSIDPFDFQAPFPLDLRFQRADLNGRNNIPTNIRWQGMVCYVVSEQKWYGLKGGTDNTFWVEIGEGGTVTIQNVSWSVNAPVNQGSDGDIWFRDTGSEIELYFKVSGSWGMLGSWGYGGGITATLNNGLDPFATTSSNLDSAYPGANVGDIVYSEDGFVRWTKLDDGKWTRTSLDIV